MRRLILIFLMVGIGTVLVACNLSDGPPTVIPTPDIPSVEFIYPSNGDQVFEGTDLTLDIIGRDSTVGVERITLFVDGEVVNEAVLPNYQYLPAFRVEMNWIASGIGLHPISAIAYRPDGTQSHETIISVEVIAPGSADAPGSAGAPDDSDVQNGTPPS